jgi:Mg/Co/Ni transporter MgtE
MTTDIISVRTDTDQEEVARQVASYNLLAIPVVDEENKLVGVITVDDVIDVIKTRRPRTSTAWPASPGTIASSPRPASRCASACRGCR